MKLIGLNCWAGHEYGALMEFVGEHKDSTDFFCLQEVFATSSNKKDYKGYRLNLLDELSDILDDFSYIFIPMMSGAFMTHEEVDFDLNYGLVMFHKKDLKQVSAAAKTIMQYQLDMEGGGKHRILTRLQSMEFLINNKKLTLMNFHGKAFPGNKLDNDERIAQSTGILEALKKIEGDVILSGDFNLLPTTKSIKMIDENLRNLIAEFGISQTRSVLTGYRGKPDEQFFADYTFVSPGIDAKSFEVPDITISDHLPMILEFDV